MDLDSRLSSIDIKLQKILDLLSKKETGPNADLDSSITNSLLFSSPWKETVDGLPALPDSALYIETYGEEGLNPVFGYDWGGYPQGMPYNLADSSIPEVPVVCTKQNKTYTLKARIAENFVTENPTDLHLLILDKDSRTLSEFWHARKETDGWHADGGIQWSLDKNFHEQILEGLDSADAAGMPILPGVIRYQEILDALPKGDLGHAIRFTYPCNGNYPGYYKLPANHTSNRYADILQTPHPLPLGTRIRIRKSLDISGFSPVNQIILRTLQKYGGILADGTDSHQGWGFQGHPDERWDKDDLQELRSIGPEQLEVVDDGLFGSAWRAEISGGPYYVGAQITITLILIQPPPLIGTIALATQLKNPQGTVSYAEPWILDFSKSGALQQTARFIPDRAGKWTINLISFSGNSDGRKAPSPIYLEVVDR